MALIPDFKNIPDEEKWDKLTAVLQQLNRDANATQDITLGKNVLLDWVDDGKTVLPQGYEVADGQRGTFKASDNKLVKIQKVK